MTNGISKKAFKTVMKCKTILFDMSPTFQVVLLFHQIYRFSSFATWNSDNKKMLHRRKTPAAHWLFQFWKQMQAWCPRCRLLHITRCNSIGAIFCRCFCSYLEIPYLSIRTTWTSVFYNFVVYEAKDQCLFFCWLSCSFSADNCHYNYN